MTERIYPPLIPTLVQTVQHGHVQIVSKLYGPVDATRVEANLLAIKHQADQLGAVPRRSREEEA